MFVDELAEVHVHELAIANRFGNQSAYTYTYMYMHTLLQEMNFPLIKKIVFVCTRETEVLDMFRVDFALRVGLVRDTIGCEGEQHVARSEQAASQQGIPRYGKTTCIEV